MSERYTSLLKLVKALTELLYTSVCMSTYYDICEDLEELYQKIYGKDLRELIEVVG